MNGQRCKITTAFHYFDPILEIADFGAPNSFKETLFWALLNTIKSLKTENISPQRFYRSKKVNIFIKTVIFINSIPNSPVSWNKNHSVNCGDINQINNFSLSLGKNCRSSGPIAAFMVTAGQNKRFLSCIFRDSYLNFPQQTLYIVYNYQRRI